MKNELFRSASMHGLVLSNAMLGDLDESPLVHALVLNGFPKEKTIDLVHYLTAQAGGAYEAYLECFEEFKLMRQFEKYEDDDRNTEIAFQDLLDEVTEFFAENDFEGVVPEFLLNKS